MKKNKYKTGAEREKNVDKGRFDLLPPKALKRVAIRMQEGTKKYSDNNWKRGMPQHKFIDSALRHIFGYIEKQNNEDHLAAAAFNILAALEQDEKFKQGLLSKEFDDLE